MSKNQKGFSVVEVLIVIVIVGLLGAVSWLVYDKQKNKSNEDSKKQATEQPEQNKANQHQKYLVIKEEGIKINLKEPILDAYVVTSEGGIAFGSASLDSIPGCKPHDVDSGPGPYAVGIANLSFDKYAEGYRTDQSPDASAFKDSENAVRVGNNWYEIEVSTSTECQSSDAVTIDKIQAIKAAFREASKTITKL